MVLTNVFVLIVYLKSPLVCIQLARTIHQTNQMSNDQSRQTPPQISHTFVLDNQGINPLSPGAIHTSEIQTTNYLMKSFLDGSFSVYIRMFLKIPPSSHSKRLE